MRPLPEHPIKEYKIGLPCMLGEVVGRIVGEDEKGSWGYINGVKMPSITLLCTPHGSVLTTGILYLSEITEEGTVLLRKYERDCRAEGRELYGGYINGLEGLY